ncbi:hypothetical protein ACQ4PT_004743 [Festuca glaucescens]
MAEHFTASGTKILATGCRGWPNRAVQSFDVRSRTLALGPRPHRCSGRPLYMPVGRGLVSLVGSFTEFLDRPPPEHSPFEWSWEELEKAPFGRLDVTCHAAHPDGRTLFVSVVIKGVEATFSLDTRAEDGTWKQHGDWTLPFQGHVHFDPALDAWVGLNEDKKYLGYLCSCNVVGTDVVASSHVVPADSDDMVSIDPDAGSKCDDEEESCDDDDLPPRWRLGKDKMFCQDPCEEHHGHVLVYMGGRSKYCLMECISALDKDYMDSDDEDDPYKVEVREEDLPRYHVLRLTKFTLKYDKNRELSAAKRRRVRCYKLLPYADPFYDDIQAFLI